MNKPMYTNNLLTEKERIENLQKSLTQFTDIIAANEWKGKKRSHASYVWCMAKLDQDIIYTLTLAGNRDIGEELHTFLTRHVDDAFANDNAEKQLKHE